MVEAALNNGELEFTTISGRIRCLRYSRIIADRRCFYCQSIAFNFGYASLLLTRITKLPPSSTPEAEYFEPLLIALHSLDERLDKCSDLE